MPAARATDTLTDRCARYRARLDAHLATLLSDKARLAFCERERAKWVERYETYQAEVRSDRYEGDATAWDFHITLSDIELRCAGYAIKEAL